MFSTHMIDARVKAEDGARASRSALLEMRHLVQVSSDDLTAAIAHERATQATCPKYTDCWYAHSRLIAAYETRAGAFADQIARLTGWGAQMDEIRDHFANDPVFRD